MFSVATLWIPFTLIAAAGQVDDTQHRLSIRVVDRRSDARPALHGSAEVLGASDLHRAVEEQRCTGRVGSGVRLVPGRALDEVHLFGPRQGARVAADPQQLPVRVADRHHAVTRVRRLAEDVVQQREDPGERVGVAIVAQQRGLERDRGDVGVRVHPGGRRADP